MVVDGSAVDEDSDVVTDLPLFIENVSAELPLLFEEPVEDVADRFSFDGP